MSSVNLSASAQKVQQALQARGLPCQVMELPASTRTAPEAAQAVGCQVGQIVKSLVFMATNSGKPVLIIASGANRVSEALVEARIGQPICKADAEFVRQHTGFAIGGVPPVGLTEAMTTLIDADLMQYPQVWAAAGTPHAVFALDPRELPRLTGGEICAIH